LVFENLTARLLPARIEHMQNLISDVIDDSVSMSDDSGGNPSAAMQHQKREAQKKSLQILADSMAEYVAILHRQSDPQPGDYERGSELARLINDHPQREIAVDIDADMANMEKLDKLEADVALVCAKKVRRTHAEKELAEVRGQIALEMDRIRAGLGAREQTLAAEILAPDGLHGAIETGAYKETELRLEKHKLWWMIGQENPAVVARTKVVFQEITGEVGDWAIESLMETPAHNWSPHNQNLIIKGDPLLLQFASQLVQTGKQGFYLMRKADAEKLKSRRCVVVVDDDKQYFDLHHLVHKDTSKGIVPAGLYPLFCLAPGQSEAELEELKDEYFKKLIKKEKTIAANAYRPN
jgi:hypothetical protein